MSADSGKNWKLLALVFLIGYVNLTLFFWPNIRTRFLGGTLPNKYPLLDPARQFIKEDDFIVNLEPLRRELRAFVAERGPSSISLYFEFLNTGANISINPDLKIWPASLAKMPLVMSAMKKIEQGDWRLDDEIALTPEDRDGRSGTLFKSPDGTRLTVGGLMKEVLVYSDNTAYQALKRHLSVADIGLIIDETGLEELFDESGRVSAKEYSRLFRALYTSSFLSPEHSMRILKWLSESDFRDFLVSGVPKEVSFAHKWGVNSKAYAYLDSGIAFVPGRPYILTVAIQGYPSEHADESVKQIMREISSKVYQYISRYERQPR